MVAILALPFLVDPEFEFVLSGRWHRGGTLEIYHLKDLVACLEFGPAPWAMLAALALRAKYADDLQNPNMAFLTAEELQAKMRRETGLVLADPNRVVRVIYATRQDLTVCDAAPHQAASIPGPKAWGKRVIETRRHGYRFSAPPENIRVEFLDGGEASG